MAKELTNNTNVVSFNRFDSSGSAREANDGNPNWGADAKRSVYNAFVSQTGKEVSGRNLLTSRLWHGVPQLSEEQMSMFEAAYTGHTFIFVVNVPKFMTTGIYKDTNMHYAMKNLKAVIERASTGFSGASNITAQNQDQEDGNGRKVSHIVNVTKEQNNVSIRLHEFAGLPVKNAIELWLTGIYDYRSQHGNYHGNLGIAGGWQLANHSMSMLVVQVTPDWTTIQDAAYYYNMVPTEVPFDHFNWTKGEQTIVDDYDIEFYANEERSPAVMYAAEKYMNNRVLSMVATSVYNSRQFVVNNFGDYPYAGFKANIGEQSTIIDNTQYNMYLTNEEAKLNNSSKNTITGKSFSEPDLKFEKLTDNGEKVENKGDI